MLDFSQGVPGDPPHPLLLEALAATSSAPASAGYGPILGEDLLRQGMAVEMERLYQWPLGAGLSSREIAITSGCNQAYLAVMMALCVPGDEVIIPVPWVSMLDRYQRSSLTHRLAVLQSAHDISNASNQACSVGAIA